MLHLFDNFFKFFDISQREGKMTIVQSNFCYIFIKCVHFEKNLVLVSEIFKNKEEIWYMHTNDFLVLNISVYQKSFQSQTLFLTCFLKVKKIL